MRGLIKHILRESISEKEMEDFAEGRGKGAEKITDSAKEKGGKFYAYLSSLQSKITLLRQSI